MTILRDISFLWSMLHIIIVFLLLFEPRYSWRVTIAVSLAGIGTLLTANVLTMFWLGHGIIMQIAFFTCTVPSMFLFLLLSQYRDGRFFFLFCLSDTVCFWLLQVTNFLDRLTGETYAVLLIGRLVAFPAVEWLFWRYLRRPYLYLQQKLEQGWWLFAAIGATYYLLIMVTAVPVDTPMPDAAGLIRICLVLALMPLTYLTMLHSLWRQMQIAESRHQVELQRRDHAAICQKMELGRLYRHDMRHHLIVLDGMLQQGDSAGAQQYVQELSGKLDDLTQAVWCANSAVNAVLTAYLAQAKEVGCQVEADIRMPAVLPYGEMDVCIILANALENAIHACQNIQEGERQIDVKAVLTDNRRTVLCVENSCPEPLKLDSDGLPAVLPHKEHGLGVWSIRAAVSRYGGIFQNRWAEGRYMLQAVLFPPDK